MISPHKRKRDKEKKPKSIIKLLRFRELGNNNSITHGNVPELALNLPFVWHRRTLDPGLRNKIFACQWITNNHVVYGTKCNSLVLYDCSSNNSMDIPLMKSESPDPAYLNPCACGIHSIQLNPSKNFLATGGENVNHVGVYRLSEFSPHCLLRDCHNDWIFDLRWLDDVCLASCSRDSSLALWRVPAGGDDLTSFFRHSSSIHCPTDSSALAVIKTPVAYTVSSTPHDRFRALEYLPSQTSLAVVSMSRRLYLYDAVRMGCDKRVRPIYSLVLRDSYQEAVALRRWPSNPNCIALATHHCVLLFDIRCSSFKIGAAARCVLPPLEVSGVRSLNFAGSVLSYGTSSGQIHFYDLRADRHLSLQLDIGPGWVKPQACDENDVAGLATAYASIPEAVGQSLTTGLNSSSWPTSYQSPPTHPIFPAQSLNIRPLQLRADLYRSHVSNLRVRLDRIQHRLSILRHHRNMVVSGATSVSSSTSGTDGNPPLDSNLSLSLLSHAENQHSHLNSGTRSAMSLPSVDDLEDESEEADNIDGEAPVELNETGLTSEPITMPFSLRRLPYRISIPGPVPIGINSFASLYPDLTTYPSFSSQRRMLAVYTHEYDPSGTRLFTAGGPIASTFHGNVAALWE